MWNIAWQEDEIDKIRQELTGDKYGDGRPIFDVVDGRRLYNTKENDMEKDAVITAWQTRKNTRVLKIRA